MRRSGHMVIAFLRVETGSAVLCSSKPLTCANQPAHSSSSSPPGVSPDTSDGASGAMPVGSAEPCHVSVAEGRPTNRVRLLSLVQVGARQLDEDASLRACASHLQAFLRT
jgi:hypothetical protein